MDKSLELLDDFAKSADNLDEGLIWMRDCLEE